MVDFIDKVAIVTGAASGIGCALSRELSRRGATVYLADINAELLGETVQSITEEGGSARGSVVDVTDFEAVKSLVDETVTESGRLDYIFNCAGIAIIALAQEHSYQDWCRTIDINLFGVYHGAAAAYPVMIKQGFGHIVNVASTAGVTPTPGEIAYTASKYGVVGLSHTMRVEGSRYGVKVSVVCPGFVETPILQSCKMVNFDRKRLLSIAVMNMTTPDRCAQVILRGIQRNRATIPVTPLAHLLWYLQRISPGLVRLVMRVHSARLYKARTGS